MTTTNANTEQANDTHGKKPTHRLYIVTGEGEKAQWRIIGAAWSHGDGKGMNLNVDALPLQGRLVLREIKDRQAEDQGQLV